MKMLDLLAHLIQNIAQNGNKSKIPATNFHTVSHNCILHNQ